MILFECFNNRTFETELLTASELWDRSEEITSGELEIISTEDTDEIDQAN